MPITDGEQRANTLAYAHARREASLEFDAAVTACLEERAEQSFACMPLDGVRTKTRCAAAAVPSPRLPNIALSGRAASRA
eukprot:scaffold297251_cov26-Tisochrysis_lutea.AAC.8